MNREQRRSAERAPLTCPECGASLRAKNVDDHYAAAHPGRSPADLSEQLDESIARRDASRTEVGEPAERGHDPDGAMAPEQAPIPNPAERRPSTQDKNVGY